MNNYPETLKVKAGRIMIVLILIFTISAVSYYLQTIYLNSLLITTSIKFGTAFLITVLIFATYLKTKNGKTTKAHHIRGTKLIESEKAEKKAKKLAKNQPSIFWGFNHLPLSIGPTHFAVVGTTGSGKTMILRLLMQSLFPFIKKGSQKRAIIYDAKQDILPLLSSIAPNTKVLTLNPFDKRSVAWDIAADVTGPASCDQLANALIPKEPNGVNQYFDKTAIHLLSGILITFTKIAGKDWTLRDVMLATKSKDRLKSILSILPDTSDRLQHFKEGRTFDAVMSTFITGVQEYHYVAAAWDRAKEKVSLRDFLNDEYILIVGNTEVAKNATDEINRVIFRRLTELILSKEETTKDQTWIFLDEVRQAGKLDSLDLLLTKGRSKGACCVLGFQDIEGMREAYGEKAANELVGQCNNKMILKLNSPKTAEWAESLFGMSEVIESRRSDNHSKTSLLNGSVSNTTQRTKQTSVIQSEFQSLPIPCPEVGLHCYSIIPKIGSYFSEIQPDWIDKNLITPDKSIPGLIHRSESEQELRDWDEEDHQRLNIAHITIDNTNSQQICCSREYLGQDEIVRKYN